MSTSCTRKSGRPRTWWFHCRRSSCWCRALGMCLPFHRKRLVPPKSYRRCPCTRNPSRTRGRSSGPNRPRRTGSKRHPPVLFLFGSWLYRTGGAKVSICKQEPKNTSEHLLLLLLLAQHHETKTNAAAKQSQTKPIQANTVFFSNHLSIVSNAMQKNIPHTKTKTNKTNQPQQKKV